MKAQENTLLISEPYLRDPSFKRSVIWLIEHSEEGSMGFVLNQPSIHELFKTIGDKEYAAPILEGGPVGLDSTFAIHQMSEVADAKKICKGFYVGGDFDRILETFTTKPVQNLWVLQGYSGWAAGQLEEEIERKSWIVAPFSERVLRTPHEHMWSAALLQLGPEFEMYANAPNDISMN